MSLFSELRRRNVFKVAGVYIVGAPLLFYFALVAQAQLDLAVWFSGLVGVLLVMGFPGALMFAWVYEITPGGLRKAIEVDQTQSIVFKTGQKLNAALAVVTVLAAVAMIADRLLPELVRPDLSPLEVIQRELILDPAIESRLMPPASGRTPEEIRSFTLENGLEVIVWPDHDIPNIALYLFVRAGSRNEVPGITGLSHFFEHMMFNGTEDVPPGEFDTIMSAAGAANNAYTSPDLTVYQDWFPSSALDTVFALEGDRFANLAIDPEVVESERGVVYSERRTRIDNSSFGALYEKVVATAWVAHPYQFPVIGWPSDIEAWTQDDLENYFRTYYAPNNMVMVIAGDITPGDAYNFARTYFGSIPSQPAPAEVRTIEPEQQGQRRVTVTAPGQAPQLHLGFHSARATDPDALAIELLSNILVRGNSSRLHRALVEEAPLAINVGSFTYGDIDPGLIYLYLTLPVGADIAAAEARVMEVLAEVIDNGVSEEELAKAKNIMLADYWRRVAMIDGKAALVGEAAVFHGDYETLFDLPVQLEALSTDALQRAAASVFRVENSTVGVFLPSVADDGDEK
jgi:zinc protease